MSILGYSASYFLPQYWANTPLYGEKLIPLLDYILSTDYVHTEQLATAFYNIESKYKNTADLPIEQVDAIIEESGYGYVKELLGQDEASTRLLVYLLVLIHQLKGSKKGIELVLSLLKSPTDRSIPQFIGNLDRGIGNAVTGFSPTSYVSFSNFSLGEDSFELNFLIKTGDNFESDQCIASAFDYGFYLGIGTDRSIVLKLGENKEGLTQRGWQEIENPVTHQMENTFKSSRVLKPNTIYSVFLEYANNEYSVKVGENSKNYNYYLTVNSSTPLKIDNSVLFVGVDGSEETYKYPFLGTIYTNLVTVSSDNVQVTQWFEKLPVGEENTFDIDSGLDGDLISVEFFTNFARFVSNYVYPTLEEFRARLTLKGEITFIPYIRQKVTYIASNIEMSLQNFMVVEGDTHVPYEVDDNRGGYEDFIV